MKSDGFIPIVTISNEMIQTLIQSNISSGVEEGIGIIAYLIGDIYYDTPIGNPLIKITQLVQGNDRGDEIYPSTCGENQISIRYESFPEVLPDSDPTLENEQIMNTVQTVFSEEKTIYKMVCYHYFQNNVSIFRFYFPFPTFKTTFEEVEAAPRPIRYTPGIPKLQFNVSKNQVDAQIFNVNTPDDTAIQPLIANLAASFPTIPIYLTITDKIYKLHVQQQSSTKMFYTTAMVEDTSESLSLCFGRISTKTDMRQDIQTLGKELMQTKEDVKSVVETMSAMKNEINDIKSSINSLITMVKSLASQKQKNVINSPQAVTEIPVQNTITQQPNKFFRQRKDKLSQRQASQPQFLEIQQSPEPKKISPQRPVAQKILVEQEVPKPEPKESKRFEQVSAQNFSGLLDEPEEPSFVEEKITTKSYVPQKPQIQPKSRYVEDDFIQMPQSITTKEKNDKLYQSPQVKNIETTTPQKYGIPDSPQMIPSSSQKKSSARKSELSQSDSQRSKEYSAKSNNILNGEMTKETSELFKFLNINPV